MPQNPNPNSDKTSNQTTNEPDSWSSPKGTSDGDFVKFDQDDQYPERIERLGNYLSDTTSGDMSNPDVRGGQRNEFPISSPGETTSTFEDRLNVAVHEAVDYFNNISQQTSFDPGVGQMPDGTYGSGHSLLSDRARDNVAESIDIGGIDHNSRWFGVGQQKFQPMTGNSNAADRYQVQRSGPNLDTAEAGGTTRFKSFKHRSALENKDSTSEGFWDNYFERLGLVGAKITLGATGYDLPSEKNNPGSAGFGGIAKIGLIDNEDLQGNYSKHDAKLIQPGETFKGASEQIEEERYQQLQEEIKLKEIPAMNSKTYGQMNSWNDPFESTGFPLVENQGLRVAVQLLEIWAMVILRIQITTALLQIASYLLSVVLQNVDAQGDGPEGFLGVNWNRNYYPPNPQIIPGSSFFKGSSGFNHPATDVLTRGMGALNRAIAAQQGAKGSAALLVSQLVGPALNTGAHIIENEYLNLTIAIQRDLNIYIPRHILSTMANETGYNSPGTVPGINKGVKVLDIATAYTRAYTAGMGSILTHIAAGDYGKSLSFWKTIFRTTIRSKAHMGSFVDQGNTYDKLLHFMGKDDKIMKFANYLATIGDIGTAAGHAGNIAFPENKVPLDQVGNFPTLATIGGRLRGQDTRGRLSLTRTPSLMLIPNNVASIKDNLKTYGLDSKSSYGNISGENPLWLKDDKIKEEIGNKYQAREDNRFSPDQVRMVEDQLEAEHMPFYIQDLRTNEIISFHAFLSSLSDSYSADWSAQKGFGRLEAAQIYGGASRSIGVSFTLVAMNPEDFDEMYYKINKLTTLVYPQWSEGTLMDSGQSTFVQPFSQVPTASPLCRLRVGDLFTSNYSKVAMARMMGIGNKDFKYTEPEGAEQEPSKKKNERQPSVDKQIKGERYMIWSKLEKVIEKEGYSIDQIAEIRQSWLDNPENFLTEFKENNRGKHALVHIKGFPFPRIKWSCGSKNAYLANTKPLESAGSLGSLGALLGASGSDKETGIASLFNSAANPILRSFNSTMGRGIAVAITGITLDWKLGTVPWNLKAGERAPRMCEVQLSVVPIHDITPGLDHQGINRAPIYKVGAKSQSLTGDVWYNETDYTSLVSGIEVQHKRHLRGEEEEE